VRDCKAISSSMVAMSLSSICKVDGVYDEPSAPPQRSRSPCPPPASQASRQAARCKHAPNANVTTSSYRPGDEPSSFRMRGCVREFGQIDNFAVSAGRMLALPCATAEARSKLALAFDDRTSSLSSHSSHPDFRNRCQRPATPPVRTLFCFFCLFNDARDFLPFPVVIALVFQSSMRSGWRIVTTLV
jgi:hypothetical protein